MKACTTISGTYLLLTQLPSFSLHPTLFKPLPCPTILHFHVIVFLSNVTLFFLILILLSGPIYKDFFFIMDCKTFDKRILRKEGFICSPCCCGGKLCWQQHGVVACTVSDIRKQREKNTSALQNLKLSIPKRSHYFKLLKDERMCYTRYFITVCESLANS